MAEVEEEAQPTLDEIFALKPEVLDAVEGSCEEEEEGDDKKGKKKGKKKKTNVQIEYDPDRDLTIVRKKHKHGAEWEEW